MVCTMKKNLAMFLCVCALAACRPSHEGVEGNYLISDVPAVSEESTLLSSLIDVKRVVPLETNDSCLIGGDVRKILKYGSRFYVSFDRTTLLAFDKDGKFVRRIGALGQGPGEYASFMDFDVDKEGIYIVGSRQMMWYAPDGTFVRKVSFGEHNIIGLTVIGDKILGLVTREEETAHLFTKDGKLLQTFLPSSKAVWVGQSTYYWPFGEDTYLMPLGSSNDVLLYDAQSEAFSYARMLDAPGLLSLERQNELDESDPHHMKGWYTDYAATIWNLNSNGRQLFFFTSHKDEGENALWVKDLPRDSSRGFRLDKVVNDVSFMPVNLFFTSFTYSAGTFLAYVMPSQLKEAISQTELTDSPYYEQMKTLAEQLDEEDNLVLIEYEFK